jgi:hypothetical protein
MSIIIKTRLLSNFHHLLYLFAVQYTITPYRTLATLRTFPHRTVMGDLKFKVGFFLAL